MWECSNCSEQIDDDLDVCWNCQAAKDGSSPNTFLEEECKSKQHFTINARLSSYHWSRLPSGVPLINLCWCFQR